MRRGYTPGTLASGSGRAESRSIMQGMLESMVENSMYRTVGLAWCTLLYLCGYMVVTTIFWHLHQDTDHLQLFILGTIILGLACVGGLAWLSLYANSYAACAPAHNMLASQLESQQPSSWVPTMRIHHLDYLRFVVNVLVVLHHTNYDRPGGKAHNPWFYFQWFTQFVEPWFMQAAAFISGCVTRDIHPSIGHARAVMRLTAGVFIFQAVIYKFVGTVLVPDHPTEEQHWRTLRKLLNADGPIWYLWALVIWKMLLPYWMVLRHPILWAVVWSLLSGFFYKAYDSGLQIRVPGHFVYYLVGVMIHQEHLASFRKLVAIPQIRIWGFFMICLHAGTACYFTVINKGLGCYPTAFNPYVDLHCGPGDRHVQHHLSTYWVNVFVRLASYPIALSLIFAAVSLMPSTDSFIRRAGSRALGPYLLHWLFLWFVEKYTSWFKDWEIKHTVPLYCLLAAYMFILYLPDVYACVLVFINVPLEKLGLLKAR